MGNSKLSALYLWISKGQKYFIKLSALRFPSYLNGQDWRTGVGCVSEGNDTSIVEYFYQLQGSVQGASSAGHFSLQNGPAIGVVWPHFIDEKSQA